MRMQRRVKIRVELLGSDAFVFFLVRNSDLADGGRDAMSQLELPHM